LNVENTKLKRLTEVIKKLTTLNTKNEKHTYKKYDVTFTEQISLINLISEVIWLHLPIRVTFNDYIILGT